MPPPKDYVVKTPPNGSVLFTPAVKFRIHQAYQNASEQERGSLFVLMQALDGRERVEASFSKPLDRYGILPGKVFAVSPEAKEKFKVLRLIGNDVILENQKTKRVSTRDVSDLLEEWRDKKYREITLTQSILETIRTVLGPVLGPFLLGALVAWLLDKLKN